MEYFSGWFCFVQTSDGQVVLVFHSPNEEIEVVNLKKGIASSFQANFLETVNETETDTQSRHTSHYRLDFAVIVTVREYFFHKSYRYAGSKEGLYKMHRTIDSEDVQEHLMEVPPRDIDFHQEDDIEYRDGRLLRSNGTMTFSLRGATPVTGGEEESRETDEFSPVFSTNGSFYMQLKVCRFVPPAARRRRAVVRSLVSGASMQENLMAVINESKG